MNEVRASSSREPRSAWAALPEAFRSRFVPAGECGAEIRRIGWLTAETVESLIEDAELCGRGARLEIRLASAGAEAVSKSLAQLAARLRRRGVSLELILEDRDAAIPTPLRDDSRVKRPPSRNRAGRRGRPSRTASAAPLRQTGRVARDLARAIS